MIIIPGMLFFGQLDATKVFLICIGKQYQQLFVIMLIVVVQIISCYLLIIVADLNIEGAALAVTISYFLGFLVLTICAYAQTDVRPMLYWPNMDSIKYAWSYFKEALPPALLIGMDMLVFEILTILSAQLSPEETAAQSIIINTYYPLLAACVGMSYSATAIVGMEIGAGRIF